MEVIAKGVVLARLLLLLLLGPSEGNVAREGGILGRGLLLLGLSEERAGLEGLLLLWLSYLAGLGTLSEDAPCGGSGGGPEGLLLGGGTAAEETPAGLLLGRLGHLDGPE